MLRWGFWFLILSFQTAFAILPTLHCAENERSLIFEEGVDDYLLDIRDTDTPTTIIGAILKSNTGKKHLLQLRIPKRYGVGTRASAMRASCEFNEARPLLFNCGNTRPTENLKITQLLTGEVMEFVAFFWNFQSRFLQQEIYFNSNQVQTENTVRFYMHTNTRLSTEAPDVVNLLRAEMEFHQWACKTGEQAESPAR